MNNKYQEDTYEKSIIELFTKELGYNYYYGVNIDRDYRSPIFESELIEAIDRINPKANSNAINEALEKLKNFDNNSLVRKNQIFMDYLQNGISVNYHDGTEFKNDIVYLLDTVNIEKNSFVVVNQWTYVENNIEKRPDIVIFINGLPLVIIELKSPSREETNASEGYIQLRNYMHDIPSMFIYNAFCVMSDQSVTKAGTITSPEDRYMEWKTKDGSYENTKFAQFDTFFEGIFQKERFINILKNFILFCNDGVKEPIKIMSAYHQYFAVNKAISTTLKASQSDDEKEKGKGGVFWHTQGSGKSLSMVFYAHLLQSKLNSPTVVVITDRNDLDDQLFLQFCKCKDFLRQEPIQAPSREFLMNYIANRKANGIIFTTMQKFMDSETPLSDRRNIVVMADEAHRSQYGLFEKVKMVKQENGSELAKMVSGNARKVRNCLPNATYIGFTGTPISAEDRNTREIFGDYIDIYDMTQAVEDGATRPVYYESRVINLKLDKDIIDLIDSQYEELALNSEEESIQKSKQQLTRLDSVLGADTTITSLVTDIINHYENNRQELLTGKAMIVAYSRPIAVKIFSKIKELRPSWTESGMVNVIMTSSNKDPEEWRDILGKVKSKNEYSKEFKDDKSSFKIAIVVDMWLTGFDVPSLATMYVYKPMTGHNLMQAIARVNRVFPEKEGGLVVDYIGIASALKHAMKEFTDRDKHNYGNTNIAETALLKFREELSICQDSMHGFDYLAFFGDSDLERARVLSASANFLLEPSRKERVNEKQPSVLENFMKHGMLLKNAKTLCSSLLDNRQRLESEYFETVRVFINKILYQGTGKKYTLQQINSRINELLKQAVQSEGVINLFTEETPEMSLFDSDFLAEISRMKQKNIAFEMLKKLIDEQIHLYKRTNLVKAQEFSEMMQKAVNTYINGMITNSEVINELLNMAKLIKEGNDKANSLGLTQEEMAFYDALSRPQAVKDFYKNEELASMTKELTELLRSNRTIDWQKKESARAGMRKLVKRLLKKYKYPPESCEDAMKVVLEQCEQWTDYSDFSHRTGA
ncbi:MAG: type I restriction endonuclease subunit R [Succinivibrionaceae bacterium]